MSRQILLCVETNKKSRTDYKYISSTIQRFYVNDRKIIYRPIFMESKTRYNHKDVLDEINAYVKKYPGKTDVIYFIDMDNFDTVNDDKVLFTKIEQFCDDNDYRLVFFKKDIEDVFWGEKVCDDEKVKKADEFTRKKIIDTVKEEKLRAKQYRNHASNILNVLDLFWTRK